MLKIRRGDIFYIERRIGRGSEQWGGRPAIVVSNDFNNIYSKTVEVVYLTTKPKRELPTHVPLLRRGRVSMALCEQISTVAVERITGYFGACSEEEMKRVDAGILISLGLRERPRVQRS